VEASDTPLASFETKWIEARPEFALALRFEPESERAARSAFACLVFEIEHAAFGIREMQPAAIKLQWWAEELARAGAGSARHPLTQALSQRFADAAVPIARWQQAILGAMAQRDPEPAADSRALLEGYSELYAPLGAIEGSLFGTDADAVAGVLSRARALRETAALSSALRDGKQPLPLDLLAAHRLARGDLAEVSRSRSLALGEWLRRLASELEASVAKPPDARALGTLRSTMAAADAKRARRAASASDPLAALGGALARLSFADVWAAWRAARRSRR